MRCINIDWLEVYALEDGNNYPCDAEYYREHGYDVVEREYGTRVWQQMFTINDAHGNPFIEIRRAPASDKTKDGGLFPKEACHIRLSNYACYASDPIGDLRKFMTAHGYILVKIFRIDICMDFITFDKGDKPDRFIRRYIEGRYSKINQANLSAHGTDTWQQRVFNSLSWGAKKSMVSTKLYCKSLELQQVHDKPYIRYSWYLAGLVDDPINCTITDAQGQTAKPDIWRVEFSITASGKKWVVLEDATKHKKTNEYVPHTLDCYDTREKLIVAFANLARYYFHFKVYEEGKRKDRCEDKVLFQFSPMDKAYRLTGNVTSRPATPFADRLIAYMLKYKAQSYDTNITHACDLIISALKQKRFNEFVGTSMSEQEVLYLQRLIADDLGALKGRDGDLARHELKTLVNDLFSKAW